MEDWEIPIYFDVQISCSKSSNLNWNYRAIRCTTCRMWVKRLNLTNIRSFKNAECNFAKSINVLIGPNNAGKSTILLPLLGLQAGLPVPAIDDVRLNCINAKAEIELADYVDEMFPGVKSVESLRYEFRKAQNDFLLMAKYNGNTNSSIPNKIPNKEPLNFIYPFVSKRKVGELHEQINEATVGAIPSTFENLYAKIDRISDPEFQPAHDIYARACDQILGFRISSSHTSKGKRAVYTVHNTQRIPLSAMGEGVMNILGLVVHLSIAKEHLFLIEEPENDVHPKALKGLMDLVIGVSDSNQFIITTHSNIVLKKLGAKSDTRIFQVETRFETRMPTSTILPVGSSSEDRRRVLQDLGYEFNDVDLWEAWLLLEESSAERIIRDFIIPWFVPSLQHRLRTYSAHSLSEVEPRFKDFNELFVFLHLEPAYKNRAWVVVDGGGNEKTTVDQLKLIYSKSGWHENQFRQFSKHQFESYYPDTFRTEVTACESIADKSEKRREKRALLNKVLDWIDKNSDDAKAAFLSSASEVIDILKEIEHALEQKT